MTQQVSTCFTKIRSDDLTKLICSFVPFESLLALPSVSRAFQARQEKWMGEEWGKLAKDPRFQERFKTIDSKCSFSKRFRLLFEIHKQITERTAEGFDNFRRALKDKSSSNLVERFKKTEQVVLLVKQQQDDNLIRLWRGSGGRDEKCVLNSFGDRHPTRFMWAPSLRGWIEQARKESFDVVRDLTLHGLTAFPPELARCRKLEKCTVDVTHMREIPEWLQDLSKLEHLVLRVNDGAKPLLDHVPPVLLRLPNLLQGKAETGADCSRLPIRTLTEEVYNQCYTWEHWLGRPFDWSPRYSPGFIERFGYLFTLFLGPKPCYGEGYIKIGKSNLHEIPFALWLRERLQIPNLAFSAVPLLDKVMRLPPEWLEGIMGLLVMAVVLTFGVLIWPINRILSLIVVPIVTKVRELLGYGRMIHIKGERA